MSKTMAFNEHMNEAYSDNSHIDKCLVTVESQDIIAANMDTIQMRNGNKTPYFPEKKRRSSLNVRLGWKSSKDVKAFATFFNEGRLKKRNIVEFLFLGYKMGQVLAQRDLWSIEESVNESQDLIPPKELPHNAKKRNTVMGAQIQGMVFRIPGMQALTRIKNKAAI